MRNPQSGQKKKRKTSEKRKKTVKEMKDEIERKSLIPITSFFKNVNDQTATKDEDGERKNVTGFLV